MALFSGVALRNYIALFGLRESHWFSAPPGAAPTSHAAARVGVPAQQPGLGFPLIPLVVMLSLATGLMRGLALGPYAGKEAGETALFRTLLSRVRPGSVILADRYFCSYFQVALLRRRGAD